MRLFGALLFLGSAAAFAPSSVRTFSTPASPSTSQLYGEYGASSTSFYTTTEKQDTYESLDAVLDNKCKDEKVRAVIKDMLDACADITEALRTALVTVEGSSNTFGDAQLSVDVIADELMWDACKNSPVVREGASEEDPEVRDTDTGGEGEFTVCWDPLDGSSIVDNNWAVGTIIGIWPKSTGLIVPLVVTKLPPWLPFMDHVLLSLSLLTMEHMNSHTDVPQKVASSQTDPLNPGSAPVTTSRSRKKVKSSLLPTSVPPRMFLDTRNSLTSTWKTATPSVTQVD